MKRLKLLFAALVLTSTHAMATIVDGVRQKPTYETTGFVLDQEMYMYNVGAGMFFTEGNSWGTQASVGETGLVVKFTESNGAYLFNDYSKAKNAWKLVFFDSETALFVDRNNQTDYYFAVDENGDGTFRISTASKNPTFVDYAGSGLYVGLMKNSSNTALSPFVDEDEAYVDWAFVTTDNYEGLSAAIEVYNKAQELMAEIKKIKDVNGDASSLETVYLNEEATMAELEAAITAAKPIYIQALINNATDKENVDVTSLLNNPEYENGTNGWTVQRANGGNVAVAGLPTNKCFEAWNNSSFDIYQIIEGAPVGVYEIEVQGFYRYLRDNAAWNAYKAQNVDYVKPQGVPVYVYLNNNATPFKNIYSEPVVKGSLYTTDASLLYPGNLPPCEDDLGNWYPNEMYNSALAFDAGMYKQSAFGLIANEGDDFRIGVKGNSSQGGDSWCIWDNFKLYYRGFKAEVVQPVLETAIADLQQYSSMLMGKTEYASLSKAFADADAAIEAQDGEAMFQALNSLYNVKESVVASKDLFLEKEVPAEVQTLSECITANKDKKFYKQLLTNANTLLAGIQGNTRYEGSEIDQLKTDVANAIEAINTSIILYEDLNTAMTTLQASAAKKAYKTLVDDATAEIAKATTAYNEGTLNDEAVEEETELLYTKNEALLNSAELYVQLAEAIGRLQAAITEASAETAHVAASTLKKGNLRLTASQKLYDEATIADADIPARITATDELITELTHSIELYRQLAAALDELKAALAKEDKVSGSTRSTAQETYDNGLAAYNDGSVDDNMMEFQIGLVTGGVLSLEESATLYSQLAEAITTLEAAVQKKAQQSLLDEANSLLVTDKSGYEAAYFPDRDIENYIIDDIDAIVAKIDASAEKYADLAAAIGRLEDAINEYGDQITKSALKKANLRLSASQRIYDAGSDSDADVSNRVEAIDQLITDMTASIILRQQYDTAIANLDAAIAAAKDKVSETMYANAAALQASIKADYEAGTVEDENIAAEIAKIDNIVASLGAAPAAYQQVSQLNKQVAEIESALAISAGQLTQAETDVQKKYLAGEFRTMAEQHIADAKDSFDAAKLAKANLQANISNCTAKLDAYNLATGSAGITAIGNELQALLNESYTIQDNSYYVGHMVEEEVNSCFVNSAYIAVLTGDYATFCSTADLDFSDVEGLKAYVATEINAAEQTVKLVQVKNVPAGTGIVLVGEAGTYQIAAGNSTMEKASMMVGTTEVTVLSKQNGSNVNYILANGQQGIGFYAVKDGSTLAAAKAYLPLPTTAEAKGWNMQFEDTDNATRIQGISSDTADTDVYYNMNGQRISKPQTKGIYIKNGKKIMVK